MITFVRVARDVKLTLAGGLAATLGKTLCRKTVPVDGKLLEGQHVEVTKFTNLKRDRGQILKRNRYFTTTEKMPNFFIL